MIYAKALTEALRDGYDPRNGTAIMERIRNRPYHSVLGFDVSPGLLTESGHLILLKQLKEDTMYLQLFFLISRFS